ncbi:TPA: glycosyltransferase family 8 protein [Clostridium perfringens]|nr:glycosyltransferase family 8 protein [Clostridium perfringens]
MDCFESDKIAHIVYASDDTFAEIMGISIVSLLHNSKDMDDIVIYILDSGISNENKKKIENLCFQYKRSKPNWITAKDISKELKMNVNTDRGSISQYARLFISSMLPDGLERVLYLDCDIIVNESIRELWELDMQGKTIAALMDAFSRQYRINIDLDPEDIMFNSGVMLIDLNKWKDNNIENKLLSFISRNKVIIQQGDQGALNAILSHDIYSFSPRFNSVTIFYDFSYKEILEYRNPPKFYSEKEIREAVEKPTIIHFTTSFLSRRPWIEGCNHKYVDEWIKYKNMSSWCDNKLWKYKREKGLRGLYLFVILKLPRRFIIKISGFLQIYGRPTMYRLKRIYAGVK